MNRATHQRNISSSVESMISQLQQSQMTIIREKRAKIMNLTEEEETKSKIFNFVMSALKKLNTTKDKKRQKQKSYRFRKSNEFSTKKRFQRRDLSIKNQIIIDE
jgi:uncharacterized spore protein YtfJ